MLPISERNLYLTTQLLDMGLPVVVVLNMMDVAADKGMMIDPEALSESLGCPVLAMVASKNEGVTELKDALNRILPLNPASFTTIVSWQGHRTSPDCA